MTKATEAMTDGSGSKEHAAADVKTIIVDPDDVIETMKRNNRDQDGQRTHVLRITPPFEGERTAKMHVSEAHTYYDTNGPEPIHLAPASFIVGHMDGQQHPDFAAHLNHPNIGEARSIFRDEYDLYNQHGEPVTIHEDEDLEESWDEWWSVTVNEWESNVRHALHKTNELELKSQHPDIESTTVSVRFEGSDE